MRQWTRREVVKAGAAASAVSLTANGLAADGKEQGGAAQSKTSSGPVRVDLAKNELRERHSLDFGWRFALGHACDPMRGAAFVQAGTTPGDLRVKVTARGLEAGEITLRVVSRIREE